MPIERLSLHLVRTACAGLIAAALWTAPALAAEAPEAAEADTASATNLERALTALAIGDVKTGCTLLQPIADSDAPEHERALEVARAVNARDRRACAWVAGPATAAATPNPEVRDGRVELMVSQGILAPVWFATMLPVYAPQSADPGAVGAMLLVGLGVGIGVPYALTINRDLTSGQALTIYTAELLGGWYGLWIEGAAARETFTGKPAHLGVLLGLGAGVGLAAAFPDIAAGDVALVRAGALWGTAYGAVVLALFADDPGPGQAFTTLGMGTTLGVAGTTALTQAVELRRGQVNVINLAGYAGLLASGAVLLIVQPDNPRAAIATLGVGSAVGLGVGAIAVSQGGGDEALARTRLPSAGFTMLRDGSGRRHPGVVLQGRW